MKSLEINHQNNNIKQNTTTSNQKTKFRYQSNKTTYSFLVTESRIDFIKYRNFQSKNNSQQWYYSNLKC